jgi:hypothetical protein
MRTKFKANISKKSLKLSDSLVESKFQESRGKPFSNFVVNTFGVTYFIALSLYVFAGLFLDKLKQRIIIAVLMNASFWLTVLHIKLQIFKLFRGAIFIIGSGVAFAEHCALFSNFNSTFAYGPGYY